MYSLVKCTGASALQKKKNNNIKTFDHMIYGSQQEES